MLPDGAWMRVLLTRESLAGAPWDGSGSWDFGEVEDYQIALPVIARPDGSQSGARGGGVSPARSSGSKR